MGLSNKGIGKVRRSQRRSSSRKNGVILNKRGTRFGVKPPHKPPKDKGNGGK